MPNTIRTPHFAQVCGRPLSLQPPSLSLELVPAKQVKPKPTPRKTSESIDDYLKAVLELGGAEDAAVSTHTLAERLGVRNPSVTGMLQKLAAHRPALVLYEKHRGVR